MSRLALSRRAGLLSLLVAGPALAQAYPEPGRRLELIVPYPPGGGNDIGARALAPMLERELGIAVVVLNRPGAASQIGMGQLARAAPDGYSIGYGLWPQTTTLILDAARNAGFTRASFTPLALHVTDPGVVVVRTDSPWRSLGDLVAAARTRPDDLRMSDNGQLGHEHLASIQLQRLAGVGFNQVHFQGAGPALTALLAGQTEAAIFAVGTAAAQIGQGAMRALAILSESPSPYLPGVTTAASQGWPIVAGSTRAFVAPAGLPPTIRARLEAALTRAIASADHAERMRALGIAVTYRDAAGFTAYWDEEERVLRPLLADIAREGETGLMATWLVKSEPDAFSWAQMAAATAEPWTGVRNAQAANFLKAMKRGDLAFFYHSNIGKEIVGVVRVVREAYPDPTDETGRWVCVDMAPVSPVPKPVTLATIKENPALEGIALVRQSRLSVMPISDLHWKILAKLGGWKA